MIYLGDTAKLAQKGYDIDNSYGYFCKTIINNKTNTKLTCYVDLHTREVSFVGDENNKKYFLNELKDNLSDEEELIVSVKELKELQDELDKRKYLDSQKSGKDTCGTYVHCIYCNKKNKYPCASAFKNFVKRESK